MAIQLKASDSLTRLVSSGRSVRSIILCEGSRDKLEVIVVDSASTDETPRLVREWAGKHPDLMLELVEESVRRGKAHALNKEERGRGKKDDQGPERGTARRHKCSRKDSQFWG